VKQKDEIRSLYKFKKIYKYLNNHTNIYILFRVLEINPSNFKTNLDS